MTRFQRSISASTKARQLYPEAFCQPMRPCSAITCRCRSRRCGRRLGRLARHRIRPMWHGDRGIGMAGGELAVDAVLVVCAGAGERSDGIVNLVEQGTDL